MEEVVAAWGRAADDPRFARALYRKHNLAYRGQQRHGGKAASVAAKAAELVAESLAAADSAARPPVPLGRRMQSQPATPPGAM